MPPPPSMRKRMTQEESVADIQEARDQFKNGEFLTAEELDKEMATW